jgi:hypothetical protein
VRAVGPLAYSINQPIDISAGLLRVEETIQRQSAGRHVGRGSRLRQKRTSLALH